MSTLYFLTPNTFVQKQGRWFKIKQNKQEIGAYLFFKIDKVIVGGSVCLSPTTIKTLLHEKIDTVFIGDNGEFLGRLQTPFSSEVEFRRIQYERLNDKNFILSLIKPIINSLFFNYNNFIKYIEQNSKIGENLNINFDTVEIKLKKIQKSKKISDFFYFIEYFNKEYYNIFGQTLNHKNFKLNFPISEIIDDKLTAMLNFGYNLLQERLIWGLNAAGIDPYLYFLYDNATKKANFVDILFLEWKLYLVDKIIWELFNRKMLYDNDFVTSKQKFSGEEDEEIYTRDDKIYLSKTAWKKFILNYEKFLQKIISYEEREITIELCIMEQAKKIYECIMEPKTLYKPITL